MGLMARLKNVRWGKLLTMFTLSFIVSNIVFYLVNLAIPQHVKEVLIVMSVIGLPFVTFGRVTVYFLTAWVCSRKLKMNKWVGLDYSTLIAMLCLVLGKVLFDANIGLYLKE